MRTKPKSSKTSRIIALAIIIAGLFAIISLFLFKEKSLVNLPCCLEYDSLHNTQGILKLLVEANQEDQKKIVELNNLYQADAERTFNKKAICENHLGLLADLENDRYKKLQQFAKAMNEKKIFIGKDLVSTPIIYLHPTNQIFLDQINESRAEFFNLYIQSYIKNHYNKYHQTNARPALEIWPGNNPPQSNFQWKIPEHKSEHYNIIQSSLEKNINSYSQFEFTISMLQNIDAKQYGFYDQFAKTQKNYYKLSVLLVQLFNDINEDRYEDKPFEEKFTTYTNLFESCFPFSYQDLGIPNKSSRYILDLSEFNFRNKMILKFLKYNMPGKYASFKEMIARKSMQTSIQSNRINLEPILTHLEKDQLYLLRNQLEEEKDRIKKGEIFNKIFELYLNQLKRLNEYITSLDGSNQGAVAAYTAKWYEKERSEYLQKLPPEIINKELEYFYPLIIKPYIAVMQINNFSNTAGFISAWVREKHRNNPSAELHKILDDLSIILQNRMNTLEPHIQKDENSGRDYAWLVLKKISFYKNKIPQEIISTNVLKREANDLKNKSELSIAIIALNSYLGSQEKIVYDISLKITEDKQFKLLDREYITQVLKERKLTEHGYLNKEDAIIIGTIIKSDFLALVTPPINLQGNLKVKLIDTNLNSRVFEKQYEINEIDKIINDIYLAKKMTLQKYKNFSPYSLKLGLIGFGTPNKTPSIQALTQDLKLGLEKELSEKEQVVIREFVNFNYIQTEYLATMALDTFRMEIDDFIYGIFYPQNENWYLDIYSLDPRSTFIKETFFINLKQPNEVVDKITKYILEKKRNVSVQTIKEKNLICQKILEAGEFFEKNRDLSIINHFFEAAFHLNPNDPIVISKYLFVLKNKIETMVKENQDENATNENEIINLSIEYLQFYAKVFDQHSTVNIRLTQKTYAYISNQLVTKVNKKAEEQFTEVRTSFLRSEKKKDLFINYLIPEFQDANNFTKALINIFVESANKYEKEDLKFLDAKRIISQFFPKDSSEATIKIKLFLDNPLLSSNLYLRLNALSRYLFNLEANGRDKSTFVEIETYTKDYFKLLNKYLENNTDPTAYSQIDYLTNKVLVNRKKDEHLVLIMEEYNAIQKTNPQIEFLLLKTHREIISVSYKLYYSQNSKQPSNTPENGALKQFIFKEIAFISTCLANKAKPNNIDEYLDNIFDCFSNLFTCLDFSRKKISTEDMTAFLEDCKSKILELSKNQQDIKMRLFSLKLTFHFLYKTRHICPEKAEYFTLQCKSMYKNFPQENLKKNELSALNRILNFDINEK